MANAEQPAAQEQQEGRSWVRTAFNFIAIYFAVNAFSSFIGGKFGVQKDAPGTDGVKPATVQGAKEIPALWPLGTKMVDFWLNVITEGHEHLSCGKCTSSV
jgi:hypothetical protein